MLVNEILELSALQLPDKLALICGDRRLTYQQINSFANKMAAYLIKIGVRRHDRVSILLDNSAESIISLFGVLKAGAIFIMLGATIKPAKLNYVLKDSGTCALITHLNKRRIIKESMHDCNALRHVIWCGKENENDDRFQFSQSIISIDWDTVFMETRSIKTFNFPVSIDVDLSNIIYTSGSTAEPKGVMSAHYNVLSSVKSISTYLQMNDNDIVMNVLPLSFDYGLYQIFITFFVRGTLLLEKTFNFPFKILEQLANEKATGFPIVPTMAALILQMEDLGKFDFTSVRFITNTAAALPRLFVQGIKKIFKGANIYSMYGLTECKRVSYLPPADLERKPESVGIPMPNTEVFIVDEAGNELPANEVGELVIRGSNVMQGYWNDSATTAKVFQQGKYRGETLLYSGDLFRKDEEGYLYFVARKDDMIKTKGERVSPNEIEEVLYAMGGISKVAVFGISDHMFGQVIVACIVTKKDVKLSNQQVKKHCARNLEPFMVPQYIKFMNEFPISTSGKIDKKLIIENYMDNLKS